MAQKSYPVDLALDGVLTEISAPSPPKRAALERRRVDSRVSGKGSNSFELPRLGVLAWWRDSMSFARRRSYRRIYAGRRPRQR